jgi:molybdate transport system substrate-binding protein
MSGGRGSTPALLVTVLLVAAAIAGCGSSPGGQQELTVFAAASLTEAFGQIGDAFEGEHDGVTVAFNFGPSDGLATQIREAGLADVFASASGRWMDAVAEDPGVTGRTDFARNRLVVLVPADNPAGIVEIADLAFPGVELVLAAEDVPAGGYAREALGNAGILDAALDNLVSNEEDVKGVVQKVVAGEADAGIVYATDVTEEVGANVRAIEIADDVNVIATYPIAVVQDAGNADLAQAFVDFVTSTEGQDVLASYGFLPGP